MLKQIVNIAGYRFIELNDRKDLRAKLKNKCVKLNLKGSILLSKEGINFFLAGEKDSIEEFINFIEKDDRFKNIELKISYSNSQPFTRMLVRLKNEIITVRKGEIKPEKFTGPKISPTELKKWYDEKRNFIVLDTRNDYEVRLGSFENSTILPISNFSEFPDAITTLPEEMKDVPIVMYCTGGIRCEKASPIMINAGFKDVYQLGGGVLRYFEKCGGEYWNGDCFVFDKRVALDSNLEEAGITQCFKCREPLTLEEQKSKDYVPGEFCPYCKK
tara:strand:+ start:650 stop:1468 length:819 start_codon:yes stop_codon:yes gene_type:complete